MEWYRHCTSDLAATCSETCSTSAEMPSDGASGFALMTEFSAIYDLENVS